LSATTIRNIVILGGGTAGWTSAAVLARVFGADGYANITLVESEAIGTVGVGEATIPQTKVFNAMLGIDEDEFVSKTQATFKLGIEFVDWSKHETRYFHPFGDYGHSIRGIDFHHYWLRHRQERARLGSTPVPLEAFNIQSVAAALGRFSRPNGRPNSPLGNISYAYHLDATLYAGFLRQYCEEKGVNRIEGQVTGVTQDPRTGFVTSLALDKGQDVQGDFFIDCSGFRGVLIEQALQTGYEDWSHWLPCDSAAAVATSTNEAPAPFTRSTARQAGWQWRIPLQHRLGNGLVYSSNHISREAAHDEFLSHLESAPLSQPKDLRFVTGRRKKFWNKNVVAIGLAAGFMEPLESTSIHLAQSGISRLVQLFPQAQFEPVLIEKYNKDTAEEYERIRDFLILHYKATQRNDTTFWNYVREMPIPDSLQHKWDMFERTGRVFRENNELFSESSWLAVFEGQGVEARGYDPIASTLPEDAFRARITEVEAVIRNSAMSLPTHSDFIAQHCAAAPLR
jgi:tryptophan halogenase